MKPFVLAALAALVLVSAAQAETLSFPSDAPVASMTFPDDWKAEETESGIQAFSPEDAISFYVDVTTPEGNEKIIGDAINFLKENGVTIDESTLKDTNDTLNGMPIGTLVWDGTDAEGPATIGLSFIQPTPESMLVITYWGTDGEQEKYGAAIDSIMTSLKPAG